MIVIFYNFKDKIVRAQNNAADSRESSSQQSHHFENKETVNCSKIYSDQNTC